MGLPTLKTKERVTFGKASAKKLRKEGRIPSVIYGQEKEPIHVVLDPRDLERVFNCRLLLLLPSRSVRPECWSGEGDLERDFNCLILSSSDCTECPAGDLSLRDRLSLALFFNTRAFPLLVLYSVDSVSKRDWVRE